MSPMLKARFSSLIFVFSLCFFSFLAGWLTAVFVLPGSLSERSSLVEKSQPPQMETQTKEKSSSSFLKEMAGSVLMLFDPYKMDSFMKKDTHLGKENSFIRKKELFPKKKRDVKKTPDILEKDSENLFEDTPPVLAEWELKRNQKIEQATVILKKIQDEYDKKNREQLLKIHKQQPFFKLDGKFGFLVNVFSEQEPAMKYIESMKENYPSWSFLLKAYKDHIRIYLGPFPSREKALEFKEKLPLPSPFSQLFLEEVSL